MKIERWFKQITNEGSIIYFQGQLSNYQGKLVWAWTSNYSQEEVESYIDPGERYWYWLEHDAISHTRCHFPFLESDI